jgi:hypothetical protein
VVSRDGALYFRSEKAKWIVLVKALETPGNIIRKLEKNNVENGATWK